MQQKINPENENHQQDQMASLKNFKITKRKGKPFWLNITGKRKENYQKYKSQLSLTQQKYVQNLSLDSQLKQYQSSRFQNTRYLTNPSQINQYSCHHQYQPNQYQDNFQDQIIQQQKQIDKRSDYLQSVLSDNQFYEEDFQSYHTTKKNTQTDNFKFDLPKIDLKQNLSIFNVKKNQSKTNINQNINKIDINTRNINSALSHIKKINASFNKFNFTNKNTPKKNINNIISNKSLKDSRRYEEKLQLNAEKLKAQLRLKSQLIAKKNMKNIKQSRLKTQPQLFGEQSFDIEKYMLLNQNTVYLKRENTKLIKDVQQLRKMIPIALANQQQLFYQNCQLSDIKKKMSKALSYQYQFKIDESKDQISLNHKRISSDIKKLKTAKIQKKVPNFINDIFIVQMNASQKVKQQLLSKMRIFKLKQQKLEYLDKKINLYNQLNNKLSANQQQYKSNELQRRKVFLKWDIQRMKNQFDLRVIQQSILTDDLNNQLQSVNQQIEQIKLFLKQQNQIELKQMIKTKIKPQIKIVKQNNFNPLSYQSMTPKKQTQNQQTEKNKKLVVKNQEYMLKKNEQMKQEQKSQTIFFKLEPSNKALKSDQKAVNMQEKSTIRIKKSPYKKASIDTDMEELIL